MTKLVLAVLAALVALNVPLPSAANTNGGCEPEPIGYCPEAFREDATFCYIVQDGRYVSATVADDDVWSVGGHDGLAFENDDDAMFYLYWRPLTTFAADPVGSPIPKKTVWREDNDVFGLQPRNFTCATFVWFGEFGQWVGPFNAQPKPSDGLLV